MGLHILLFLELQFPCLHAIACVSNFGFGVKALEKIDYLKKLNESNYTKISKISENKI